jgi:hypothetical protein
VILSEFNKVKIDRGMIVDVRDELAREAILILQEIKQDLLTFD